MPDTTVELYVIQNDPHSRAAKELLESLNVAMTEIDITNNPELMEKLVELTGQWTVPAVVVRSDEGQKVVVGYEPEAIKQAVKST